MPISVRKHYPEIPWKEMAGMRYFFDTNVLIGYLSGDKRAKKVVEKVGIGEIICKSSKKK